MPDWFRRRNADNENPPPQALERAKQEVAAAAAAIPEGLYSHCAKCGHLLYNKDFERDLKVCSRCGYHHPLTADERIAYTVDPGSWLEHDADLRASDPLTFPDYAAKAEKGRQVTGRGDTLVAGTALIGGRKTELLVADFRFMGGSMGSVFGEKFVRAADRAIEQQTALLTFVASGGARMQEGLFGLMQMAKTSSAVAQLGEAHVPYITVLTHPTTGGAFASFASLGDIILAEPSAYVAFAGARVAQQAKTHKEPDNYQTAEFQWEHGMIDRVVPRKEMQTNLEQILAFFSSDTPSVVEGRGASSAAPNGNGSHASAAEATPLTKPKGRNGKGDTSIRG